MFAKKSEFLESDRRCFSVGLSHFCRSREVRHQLPFAPGHLLKDVCITNNLGRCSIPIQSKRQICLQSWGLKMCLPSEQRVHEMAHYKDLGFLNWGCLAESHVTYMTHIGISLDHSHCTRGTRGQGTDANMPVPMSLTVYEQQRSVPDPGLLASTKLPQANLLDSKENKISDLPHFQQSQRVKRIYDHSCIIF